MLLWRLTACLQESIRYNGLIVKLRPTLRRYRQKEERILEFSDTQYRIHKPIYIHNVIPCCLNYYKIVRSIAKLFILSLNNNARHRLPLPSKARTPENQKSADEYFYFCDTRPERMCSTETHINELMCYTVNALIQDS